MTREIGNMNKNTMSC